MLLWIKPKCADDNIVLDWLVQLATKTCKLKMYCSSISLAPHQNDVLLCVFSPGGCWSCLDERLADPVSSDAQREHPAICRPTARQAHRVLLQRHLLQQPTHSHHGTGLHQVILRFYLRQIEILMWGGLPER